MPGESTAQWGRLLLLAAGAFTTALNVTLLSPLIPDIAREFEISDASAGQLATLTAASSGIMALTVAPWMDRYSRSFWFRLECGLLATGCLISAIAPTFALMFVGRFLCGIGGAVIGATCLAACGDIFPQKDVRNRAIGIVNSAFSLGAIFGLPVVALTADAVDWRLAIALPAPLALLVFLGTGRMPRREIGPPTDSAWNAWRAGYSRVIRSAETMWLLATLVLLMVVWFGWLIYFGAFTEDVYGTTAALLSLMFLVGGGAEMLANNVAPVLIRNRSPKLVACPFALLFAVNLMLVGVALDREWTMFPFIALGSGAGAAVFVCLNIALLDSLPGSEGAAMSLQSAGLELGGAAGVAATGLALALLDDFERVYQLLGVVAPLLIVTIWISSRVRKEPVPGPSLQPAD